MRTLPVVILAPAFDFLPRVFQAREPIRVQTLIAQPAVEAFKQRRSALVCLAVDIADEHHVPRSTQSALDCKTLAIVERDRFRQSPLLEAFHVSKMFGLPLPTNACDALVCPIPKTILREREPGEPLAGEKLTVNVWL